MHPLRVESVAWVAERKDVLSGCFALLLLWVYCGYARRPFSWLRYLAVMIVFAMGLMSKAMLVTLPVVLLLLDYWPLRRLGGAVNDLAMPSGATGRSIGMQPVSWRRLIAEKIPLVVLAGATCAITLATQSSGSSMSERPALAVRLANATWWCMAYIGQFFAPVSLAPFNTIPKAALPAWQVAAAASVLISVTVGAFLLRRRAPYLIVGWLWYLVMLLPVIGLVPVGTQGMADRYTYLSQIGLAIALVWAAADGVRAWSISPRTCRWASGVALAALAVLAFRQTTHWRDSDTLWQHTLACSSDPARTHGNIAQILVADGQVDKAGEHYQAAVELDPDDASLHSNLGTVLGMQGRAQEAIAEYRRALELRPAFAGAHYNLAVALFGQDRLDEAIDHLQAAVALQPKFPETHYNLGLALVQQRKLDDAASEFRETLRLQPRHIDARCALATVLAWQDHPNDAINEYRKALHIEPGHLGAATTTGHADGEAHFAGDCTQIIEISRTLEN